MKNKGDLQGLIDIWYYNEINHKNSIFNYLKDFECDDDVVDAGLGMIKNIDGTLNQIQILKEMGK